MLAEATFSSHVGTSVVPPFLIGALTAAGLHVALAFMFLNALSWLGIGLMLTRIGSRHFDWDATEAWLGLILCFGHFSVMRSLLFLQTDPLALLLLCMALWLNLELLDRFTLRRGLALVAVQTIGFFTKLSFAPAFAIPLLAPLCRGSTPSYSLSIFSAGANLITSMSLPLFASTSSIDGETVSGVVT